MSIEQYIESTKYLQWQDGMYVMLDDMECDYERALIEDSLRDSRHLVKEIFFEQDEDEDCIGVDGGCGGLWWEGDMQTKLTREQALYIATGETTCTK
tara:strand:+ start:2439 stop:2729 length:291 start_codon:yes stop_codon:yes gene_type:complete